MAIHFRRGEVDRKLLLDSLIPLYFARTAGFINESLEVDSQWVEEILEANCRVYEEMKPYLLEKWG